MKPWSVEECEAYAKQLRDKTRANTAEHAAQAIEYLLGLVRREWVGLTDEAVWSLYKNLWMFHPAEEPRLAGDILKFARAIEAKLREKNNG